MKVVELESKKNETWGTISLLAHVEGECKRALQFIVALGFDSEKRVWEHGHYFEELSDARQDYNWYL